MVEQPITDGEQILMSVVLNMPEGDIITHNTIEDLILIKSGQGRYYSFMRSIDKQMLYYGKGLKTIKGIGYRVVGSEAIVDKALKMIRNSEGKVGNALTLINGIDRESLNDEYRVKFDLIQVKFTQVHKNLAGGVKELMLLDKPNRLNRLQSGGIK